jgi:hypothetical protein
MRSVYANFIVKLIGNTVRHIICTLHDKLQRQRCPAPVELMLNRIEVRNTNKHAQSSGDISAPWNSKYKRVEHEGVRHIFLQDISVRPLPK